MPSWGSFKRGASDFLLGSKPIGVDQATLRNDAFLQEQYKNLIAAQPGQARLDRGRIDALLAQQQGTVGQMGGLAQQLQAQASGQGGAGTMAAQRSLLDAQRGIQSQAASVRGLTAGAAARAAMQQSAIAAAEGAGNIGMVRAQEQDQARGSLAALLGQQAGVQGQQAGLEAGLSGQNLQALIGQQAQADQLRLAGLSGLQGLDEAERQRMLAILQQNQRPGALGGLFTAGGAIAGGLIGGAPGAGVGAQVGGAFGPAVQR